MQKWYFGQAAVCFSCERVEGEIGAERGASLKVVSLHNVQQSQNG